MTLALPAELMARPAALADVEALVALFNAYSVALTGAPQHDYDDVLEDLDDPDLDREHDTRVLVGPDGRLAAYICVWSTSRPALPFVETYLHPDYWADPASEASLLAWAEARVRQNEAIIPPDVRLAMRTFADVRDVRFHQAATAFGFTPIRHSFKMGMTFSGQLDAAPLPDGITLRVAEREDDPTPVFEAFRDAWRDHFGYVEGPYEQRLESFRHHWAKNFAPGLWLTALAGDTVAGLSLCLPKYGPDETQGFVQLLAVRRAFRRRGLAEALLRNSFVALQRAGKASVSLHVDGESLTGATRLYERAGMAVLERHTQYEKELRPGVDPSTRAAGA